MATIIEAMFIVVVPASAAEGSSLSYTFTGSNTADAGYAEGTITFKTASEGTYYLYWADDEKALDGYDSFIKPEKRKAGESITVNMGYHTAIPADATKIIATKGSKKVADADAVYSVPESKQLKYDSGELLYTFNSYSDVHIDNNGYYKKAEEHLAEAFQFAVEKNTDFIVSSGDMVTNKTGPDSEWAVYEDILKNSNYMNPVWEADGNHDMRCGAETGLASFIRATGTDSTKETIESRKPYYYIIEPKTGDLFIFMALENEDPPNTSNQFSDEQLEWVTDLLEEYYDTGVNVFLIEHSPIEGFGAGDRMSKPYYKALLSESYPSTVKFKKLLKKYKNMIFMSGHTHEDFNMGYNYSNENNAACHMIHNPAVAGSTVPNRDHSGLYYNDGFGENSQGYYVETYQNKIVFYGANLTTKLIYPQYNYIMEGSHTAAVVNTEADEIILSGVNVSPEDKLNETADLLARYKRYSSYDQYQALKKLYFGYKDADEADRNVVTEFNKRINDLKKIIGVAGEHTYTVGNKYYFENTKSWSKVYAYAWTSSKNNADWPGVLLSPIGTSNGKELYCIEFDRSGQYRNLIFSNGDRQTADIVLEQYPDNAFHINGKDSDSKYTVENFRPDNDSIPTDRTYALLYYIDGEHAWNSVDTWMTSDADGTYSYTYEATDNCSLSFSVYDMVNKKYKSLPDSMGVDYANGETFESGITTQSTRGKSLTIRNMSRNKTVRIVFDPSKEKLFASCVTLADVTWQNYDGTTLETDEYVPFGTMPEYNGAVPTREGNAQYTYTFSGWDPTVTEVNGDVEYTAVFDESINTYTVKWVSAGGTVLETDEKVSYGTMPSFDGKEPEYDGKRINTASKYHFLCWIPESEFGSAIAVELEPVKGDITYIACYEIEHLDNTDTDPDTSTDNGSTDSEPSVYDDSDTENADKSIDSKPTDSTDPETETDKYSESDTVTDNDTSADIISDTDTNYDIDTSSDKSSDTESETDTDTQINSDTDTNKDVDTETDTSTAKPNTASDKADTSYDKTNTASNKEDTDSEDTSSDEKDSSDTPDKPVKKILLGDVNGDGKVTAKDSMMIQRYTIHLIKLSDDQLRVADIDSDKRVTSKDAMNILRFTVNLATKFAIGKYVI